MNWVCATCPSAAAYVHVLAFLKKARQQTPQQTSPFACVTFLKHHKKVPFFRIQSFSKGIYTLFLLLLFFSILWHHYVRDITELLAVEEMVLSQNVLLKKKKYFPWLHLNAANLIFCSSSFIGEISEVLPWGHQLVGREHVVSQTCDFSLPSQ